MLLLCAENTMLSSTVQSVASHVQTASIFLFREVSVYIHIPLTCGCNVFIMFIKSYYYAAVQPCLEATTLENITINAIKKSIEINQVGLL